LALQLIDQISEDSYDPTKYEDEEKKRVLAAIEEKIQGKQIVASAHNEEPGSGQVIDLMEALKASLGKKPKAAPVPAETSDAKRSAIVTPMLEAKGRKPARRASQPEEAAAAPTRSRGKK
jgi:DNA end-binding protein Ku